MRYFSSTRISLYSGRDPSTLEPVESNATGLWYRVLWVGLAGQVVWAGLALTDFIEGPEYLLRFTSLLATVLAAYYDMQYVGRRARWPGPQRWFLAFLVFLLNPVTADRAPDQVTSNGLGRLVVAHLAVPERERSGDE